MALLSLIELQLYRLITRHTALSERGIWQGRWLMIIGAVGITSLVAWLAIRLGFPSPQSLNMLFVLPVLWAAITYGLVLAIICSVLAVVTYDILVLPVGGSMAMIDPANIAKFMILLFVAVIASALAARVRSLSRSAREQEKERLLAALLSSISHDLKTPLVTVIGALSALSSFSPIMRDAGWRDIVQTALEEASKLNRFITNILEISRLETGGAVVSKEAVLLRDILASVLKTLRPMIGQRTIVINIPPDFPLLLVNAALMELVLLNLLDNALKYAQEGAITITATWSGNEAIIDIQDQGPGIPLADHERIFTKFYRVEKGDRKIAGTGLGLYICKEIMRALGGNIAVQEIPFPSTSGTCMRITLPAQVMEPFTCKAIEEE